MAIESFVKKSERFPNSVNNKQSLFKPRVPVADTEVWNKQLDAAHSAKHELEQLMKKPALTAEERYQILDCRDKYIRISMDKSTDISNATYTSGTCTDLCPEKERWMREATSQVTSFEQLQSANNANTYSQQIDHTLAVKQYSRSSADQESPLPYELRNERALRLTMHYLLRNIINLLDDNVNCTVNISDWYHFLWDRTRSLRKDITQQVLCSQNVVELVEQCARFHIHCSARLINEDPSVFDQKINTENLTKCLQTLKYMYNDLRLRKLDCKNEAEFRGYIVLLNLNDGNFLWEMKQLSKNILNSTEVRFALAVYFAIETNNYVKFFDLVRQTTYMNACILLRYFVQMRLVAMKIIMKGYQVKNAVQFSINYFTNILAFEGYENTCHFFEYHGIICDREQGVLHIDKKMFYYPDMPYTMNRAIIIIESKRNRTAAGTIFGDDEDILEKSMIELRQHIPHSSFDKNGYLLKRSVTAADQNFVSKIIEIMHLKNDNNLLREKDARNDNNLFKIPSPTTIVFPSNNSPFRPIGEIRGDKKSIPDTISSNRNYINKSNFTNDRDDLGITPLNDMNDRNDLGITPLKPASSNPFFGENIFNKHGSSATDKSIFSTSSTNVTVIEANSKFTATLPTLFGTSDGNIFNTPQIPPFTFDSPGIIPNPKPELNFIDTKRGSSFSPINHKNMTEQRDTDIAIEEEKRKKKQMENELRKNLLKKEAEERALNEQLKLEQKLATELAENLKQIENTSESVFREICNEIIEENTMNIATQCVEEFDYEYNILPDIILNEIITEVIDVDVNDLAQEEIQLKNMSELYKLKIMHKYFNAWYRTVGSVQLKRNRIENTPSWLPNETINEQVEHYSHPLQNDNLLDMKRYISGNPIDIKLPDNITSRIDLLKLIKSKLFKKEYRNRIGLLTNHVYWKVTISIPYKNEESCAGFFSYIDKWLGNIFLCNQNELLDHHYLYLEKYRQANSTETLVSCIRKLRGCQLINEKNDKYDNAARDSSNGVIFILQPTKMSVSKKRLAKLMETADVWGPVPLAIIVYNSSRRPEVDDTEMCNLLKLGDLLVDNKISDYKIFQNRNLRSNVEDALKYLSDNYCVEFDLEMQKKTSFVSSTLGEEIWNSLRISAANNHVFMEISYDINLIINIYNEAIERVINIVMHDFSNYPEFPVEFRDLVPESVYDIKLDYEHFPEDWKDPERQKEFQEFFKTLKLQQVKDPNWRDISTWQDLEKMLKVLIHSNVGASSDKTIYKVINYISQHYSSDSDDGFPVHKLNRISWIDIVRILAIESLNRKWNTKEKGDYPLPDEIIYNKTEYDSFIQSPWWLRDEILITNHPKRTLENLNKTTEVITMRAEAVRNGEPEIKKLKFSKEDIESIIEQGYSSLKKADEKLLKYKHSAKESRETSKEFEIRLYQQEEIFRNIRNQISQLDGD